MNIFITGGTGFLGQHLVRKLSTQFKEVYVLSRKSKFKGFEDLPNVKIIKGDISYPQMIEGSDLHKFLFENIDIVIHAAALYDVKASYSESYMHNIIGTQNTLRFARKIKNLRAFYYISTIAVGDENSFFLEEDHLPERKVFNDHYSETKYYAEKLVRELSSQMNIRIFRPGIVVGDSRTGKFDKIDGPYYFMNAIKKRVPLLKMTPFVFLSFNAQSRIPMIPVDHCVDAISEIIKRDSYTSPMKTFHLVSDEIPTINEFLADLNNVLGIKTRYLPVMRNIVHDTLLSLIGIPRELIPFMFSKLSYDKKNTLEVYPEIKQSTYIDYKDKLFFYLQEKSKKD